MALAKPELSGRPSLWLIAATAGLIALGFRPERFSHPTIVTADEPAPPRAAPGWKDLFLCVGGNISGHHLLALAAGMTFYSLLAIFPALAALVAIYGLFADPQSITTHLNMLSGLAPAGALDVAKDQLNRVASKGGQALSLTFFGSFVIALWSANSATKSLFETLNVVFDEKEKRSFVKLNALSLAFTAGGVLFILLALGAVVVLPIAFHYLGLSGAVDLVVRIGRWPALFIILSLALAVIYCFGPSRDHRCWRWVSWGSLTAAFLWLAASVLFSWYAANFGNYNETYGSLGAAIGFMTWLWISAIAILLGAEVDAALENAGRASRASHGQV